MTVEYKGMPDNVNGGTSDKRPVLIDKRYDELLAQIAALKAEYDRLQTDADKAISHRDQQLDVLKDENEKLKQQKAYAEAKLQQVQHARDNDWGL